MKTVCLPSGETVPALGIGTWYLGEFAKHRADEIACIRLALDSGVRLIDTAEMYGEGAAEKLVGEAIAGRREEAFLVSKVYPYNASRQDAIAACERSLKRLGTDHLDLYLLHWRGGVPFEETLEAFTRLKATGKIRHFGVSNLDTDDMEEWYASAGGQACATNQVLYNLGRRGIELNLLPWLRQHKTPVMAYSPIEQARLLHTQTLRDFARDTGISPLHAALGWLLAQDDVIAIPRTGRPEHLREILQAAQSPLSAEHVAELDRLFPRPKRPIPLEML
ncbi:aldo/keto reductase [Uliginosibacterium gangwonense]|uniref:aldo/keto reductase n=1 Tax=Uliginosibacterium gangwonense TaxID=392736 RepID=UPI00037B5300|nr:aldo/keto reductase [Uliginosibacterium gangwonense]